MKEADPEMIMRDAIAAIERCPATFVLLLIETSRHCPALDPALKTALAAMRAYGIGVEMGGNSEVVREQMREAIAEHYRGGRSLH